MVSTLHSENSLQITELAYWCKTDFRAFLFRTNYTQVKKHGSSIMEEHYTEQLACDTPSTYSRGEDTIF